MEGRFESNTFFCTKDSFFLAHLSQILTGFVQVTGSLETKYKIKEHGVGITEKWTTDNR